MEDQAAAAVLAHIEDQPHACLERLEALAARGKLPIAARRGRGACFYEPSTRRSRSRGGARSPTTDRPTPRSATTPRRLKRVVDGAETDEALEDAADQIRKDCERCYIDGAGEHFAESTRQSTIRRC